MLDLVPIRKRLAAAIIDTGLSWAWESCGEKGDGANIVGVMFHPDDENAERPLLGRCDPIYDQKQRKFRDYVYDEKIAEIEHSSVRRSGEVAEFISHAPTDVFSLLAEVERLRAALKPLASLTIPARANGNAGAYSIRHEDIRAAHAALGQ